MAEIYDPGCLSSQWPGVAYPKKLKNGDLAPATEYFAALVDYVDIPK
jgi:hypothetical protein